MRAISGGDGGVLRPQYSGDYAPYPETFGARIFRSLAEVDEATVQGAGHQIELCEELENVEEDIKGLGQENMDLREELSEL